MARNNWTWDKLMRNSYRLNPKSRGPNSPYTPKFEIANYTSGPNRGQKVIVPFVGTKSVLFSLRAWGVTQASLHNITMFFSDVEILKEDPQNENYFQIEYEGTMYWIHKIDRLKNPLSARCTCFTKDTQIMMADGTYKSFEELEGKSNFDIISYNEKADKFEIVTAYNCEKKKQDAQLLEIYFDNGTSVKCTPDHRFLTREGNWIQAKDLQENESLRALYLDRFQLKRILPDGDKETIKKHKAKEDFYVYVYLDPRYPGQYKYTTCEFNFKPIYVGKGIRNRCWNHLNMNNIQINDPFHNTLRKLKEQGIEPIVLRQHINLDEQVAYKIENQLTQEIGLACENKGPLLNLKHGGEGGLHKNSGLKTKLKNLENAMKQIISQTSKANWQNPEIRQRMLQNKIEKQNVLHTNTIKQLVELCKKSGKFTLDGYIHVKDFNYSISTIQSKKQLRDKLKQEVLEKAFVNHKVVKIVKLQERQDVYCLTAEYLGNFVIKTDFSESNITSGVVVENCKDFFFTWAYYNYVNGRCLYGPMPKPYQRKTTTRPPRNPSGMPGICKHIYNAWTLLRNSGFTMN